MPRTRSSSRRGRSPTCSSRSEWQVGCSVTRCGNVAPTSSVPSTSQTNSVSSYTRSPAPFSRQVGDARGRRRHDGLGAGEHALEPAGERVALVLVARVAVHLAAAGLRLGEVDLAPEALQQLHDRTPRLREQRVVEAGDEQRDPHRRESTATRRRRDRTPGRAPARCSRRPRRARPGRRGAGPSPGPGGYAPTTRKPGSSDSRLWPVPAGRTTTSPARSRTSSPPGPPSRTTAQPRTTPSASWAVEWKW